MRTGSIDTIADIVTFWLSDSRDSPDRASARRSWWYRGGPVVDEEIRARFGGLVPRALAGELAGWRETPHGALALVLLLDQFTRNLYRGTVEAYAGDAFAFEIVNHAIGRGLDRALHPVARIWLWHPFHHSEAIAEQDRGLGLLRALRRDADPAWRGYVGRCIKGWTRHRDIVARFDPVPASKRRARSRQHYGRTGIHGGGWRELRSEVARRQRDLLTAIRAQPISGAVSREPFRSPLPRRAGC